MSGLDKVGIAETKKLRIVRTTVDVFEVSKVPTSIETLGLVGVKEERNQRE